MFIQKLMLWVLVCTAAMFLGACRLPKDRYEEGREVVAKAGSINTEEMKSGMDTEEMKSGMDTEEMKASMDTKVKENRIDGEEISQARQDVNLQMVKTEPAKSVLRVGAVAEAGEREDSFYNLQIIHSFAKASEELHVETIYLESSRPDDYEKNLEILAEEHCGLIFVPGREMAHLVPNAASLYPKIKFVVVDGNIGKDLDNVACLTFELAKVSYLAGVGAGILTKTNQVGLIIHENCADENSAGYGYYAGVLDVNAKGEVNQKICFSDLTDQEEAKQAVSDMKEKGVDVIFYGLGIAGEKLVPFCQEAGIRVIGTDRDYFDLIPETYLASSSRQIQIMVWEQIKDVIDGKWENGIILCDMENQGTDFFMNEAYVPEELKQALQTVKERLQTGEIAVPDTKDTFEAAYGER